MNKHQTFNPSQIHIITGAVHLAEELVSDFYKLSYSQWLRKKYDIRTLADLSADEIVNNAFAQILHYKGRPRDSSLESKSYDFYKICLQDHAILSVLHKNPEIYLFPFSLYIIIHELVHIVRFSKFLQNFYASFEEKITEEKRVHDKTREILKNIKLLGIEDVLDFYSEGITPIEDLNSR